jgi:murein DD-endopeptidase MepM/ murein hydrolase activator NlpD
MVKSVSFLFLMFILLTCTTSKHISRQDSGTGAHSARNLQFAWPVEKVRVTSYYGWRSSQRIHEGIDLGGPRGTKIFASESGRVVENGWLRGFGRVVIIKHDDVWSTLYAHLSASKVKIGQPVKKGQEIGTMGNTGRATGVHLHFEIRRNADPVDPIYYLPKIK